MLVIHDWEFKHFISDPNAGNIEKKWIGMLPGFNEESFPILIMGGWEGFNIVNVKTLSQQVLV